MKVYGRGDADLERRIEKLQEQVEGYKALIELYKKQLWELRLVSSENEKNINLLQGYKKVIKDLTAKLRRKDS
jgi:predicted RNase H-like nuclease (RuvC/YqgF family)|tara:strand:+ start:437 stop:655 length:219 start_codon:yes stop_codon:yes gene_type:complete